MEFFQYKNKIKAAKGMLLVSEPYLPDPNFERTIILLCEHHDQGSFGFVLNKLSESTVNEVMEDSKGVDGKIYIGGPVQQDTLHFVHRNASLEDATEISEGIYWGGNFEKLQFLLETKQMQLTDVRFFLGYSGWSAGQLEEELKADTWIVSDQVTTALIFETDPAVMWQAALKSMGGKYSVFSNYPVDPRLN